MKRGVRQLSVWALMAAFLGGPTLGLAAQKPDSAQAKAKLTAIRARIADLAQRIGSELQRRDAESARLREAELRITAQRRRLEELRIQQTAAERRRNGLIEDQSKTRRSLDAERHALAEEMRAAYMIGRQEPIKMLLNQNNPATFGRNMTYYGYFARQRSAKIEAINGQVAHLQELLRGIDAETLALNELERGARSEMAGLEQARSERSMALSGLSKQVSSGNQELSRLKREAAALENLLADLARVMQDFPVDSQQPFDRLRGKLSWPVIGQLAAAAQRNGVLIETEPGAKVRAPYFGRVVYADWLQGLGLLMIIGHGGGYLSLYGHSEVLYKSVGDWVAPGDLIAAMGESPSTRPRLYFEIRDGRKPVDTRFWLKSRP